MVNLNTGRHTLFLKLGHISFSHLDLITLLEESPEVRVVLGRLHRQRVLRRDREIGCPHKGIRPGRINIERAGTALQREADFDALRASDPVALHRLDLVWPFVELVQIIQQLFGVICNLHEPLGQFASLNRRI